MYVLERLSYALAILILILLWQCPDDSPQRLSTRMQELLQENSELHTTVETTHVRARSLERALHSLSDEHTQTLDLLRSLQANPKVVTQIRTVQVGSTHETPELPEEHKFTLESGLVVGMFSNQENYRFVTYDLHTRATVMIGRDQGAALLQIKSSYDPHTYYDIPVDSFEILDTTQAKNPWRPQVSIGVRAGFPIKPASQAQLTGQLLLTGYNQECYSLLGVSVAANTSSVHFGIVPGTYNIGCHIKHVDNIQLVPDVFIDHRGRIGTGIGLATKF